MDPDAAWEAMLRAYGESDWESAFEHAEALLGWLRIDGFPPKVSIGLKSAGLFFDFDHEVVRRSTADSVARSIVSMANRSLSDLKE